MNIETIMKHMSNKVTENFERLTELDSVVGDGDLGLTMRSGFNKVYESVSEIEEADNGKLLFQLGKIMGNTVPSTMGTLMAKGLMEAGKRLKGNTTQEWTIHEVKEFVNGYFEGVSNLGKAKVGEKTFLDAYYPAVEVINKYVDGDIQIILKEALDASNEGFDRATKLVAKHGRAAARGDQSIGVQDAGAAVAVLWFEALYDAALE